MNESRRQILVAAQTELDLFFPEKLFQFLNDLEESEVKISEREVWFFLTDVDPHIDSNPIINASGHFEEVWGLRGIVFAENDLNDCLVVLPEEFGEQIFVMIHRLGELRLFANSIEHAITAGPRDYLQSENFVYRLEEDGTLVRGGDHAAPEDRDPDEPDGVSDIDKRAHLDQLIEDEQTDKLSEIIQGLNELIAGDDESNKVWALNKLSDIYLKGFGAISQDMSRALHYNQLAIDLKSHVAMGNRAACYLLGMGMEKNLDKALELATKANELSRGNRYANLLASTPEGGLYDQLVEMIMQERKRSG